MTIGQRIKIRREELNMSQDDLAKKVGYKSRSSINKIELDLYSLKQSKIKAIADALETTPSYIMGWDEEAEEAKRLPPVKRTALMQKLSSCLWV
ncbi:MAG: helix-turn-helix domain-containing protein [Gemmiger formicilis]|uniref:helix-turn-helix domain-containing protein n=1 Tax=Gemmiger formicilis TaxID=745368 RepID=UPI0039A36A68